MIYELPPLTSQIDPVTAINVERRPGDARYTERPTIPPAAEASGPTTGAFFGLYTDADGSTWLQGGSVTGSNGGSATLGDTKVIDHLSGITAAAGSKLYLSASVTATADRGLMLPGTRVNDADLTTSLPANHTFTATSLTGTIGVEIGRWTADGFMAASAGNYVTSACVGAVILTH